MRSVTGTDPVIRPAVQLIRAGNDFFSLLLKLIHEAVHSVHLQTYIFEDDETGILVADALKHAAERGVAVYLMADGYASQGLSKLFIHQLKEAGVHFRFFDPLFKSSFFYFGRRLHHKVFVADAAVALVGGMNIANRYNDMPGEPAWLDYAVYTTEKTAAALHNYCTQIWEGAMFKKNEPVKKTVSPLFNTSVQNESKVAMRVNDWVRKKNEISATYIHLFRNAHSHITILCSYFLPGSVIRRLIKAAIARGVKIKVIVAGASDVAIAKNAERWLYDWLLRNKIELYEYQPAILHGKLAVCDGKWFTIGSYNINNISAYASIELNLDITDEKLAAAAEGELEMIIQHNCKAVTPKDHIHNKNIVKQFFRWLSYEFIRVVFYLFTFYFKQRRN
ncbi:MAG: phospholipase [Chitinophagaceae bacterium]|nr:phospholipase [Chitinophagaceae bacterium]